MKNYSLTLLGLGISVLIFLITLAFDFDLFESLFGFLHRFEEYEVDEIVIPIFVFFVFVIVDLERRRKAQKVELEKLKIYKAMMASTQHILNNFLNQMQLFKITADKTPGFEPEILALYDQIIHDASMQIEALGNITSINESSIETSIAPKKKNSTSD